MTIQVNINCLTTCHPERSEGSWFSVVEMLRYAQHDITQCKPNKVTSNNLIIWQLRFLAIVKSQVV
jgi:hypothetical protein